jgi:hypothetical protein
MVDRISNPSIPSLLPLSRTTQGGAQGHGGLPFQAPASSQQTPAQTAALAAQTTTASATQEQGESGTQLQPLMEQLLLQRAISGQVTGQGGDALLLAQALRELVLSRMRQLQSLPPVSVPASAQGKPQLDAATMALLQNLLPDLPAEALNAPNLNAALFNLAQLMPNNAAFVLNPSLLPQFWMFHAWAWSGALPFDFWLLHRDPDEAEPDEPQPRPDARAPTLRLRVPHPVHGLLWLDVRLHEGDVSLDIYAEHDILPDEIARLRAAINAALMRADLRLRHCHIRQGHPPQHEPQHEDTPEENTTPQLLAPSSTSKALAFQPLSEAALPPELFTAASEVLGALRA